MGLILIRFDLFFVVDLIFGAISKKPLLNLSSQRFNPMLSSKSFKVLVLTFRSETSSVCVCMCMYVCMCAYVCVCVCVCACSFSGLQISSYPFVKKTILFPLNCLDILVKNQLTIKARICFCTLHSVLFISMCILMPVPLHLDYCNDIMSCEMGKCASSKFFKLFWLFDISCTSINFRDQLVTFC